MQFVDAYPCLYRGKRMQKSVQSGICAQSKWVEAVVVLAPDNMLCAGADVYPGEHATEAQAKWYGSTGSGRLAEIYRAALLLEHEPVITEQSPAAAIAAVMKSTEPQERQAIQRAAAERYGARIYERVLTEMPERLIDALHLLRSYGVTFDAAEITDEVRSGNLVYKEQMRELGIETPDKADARKQREDRAVEPFLPAFQLYLHLRAHAHLAEECRCLELMKSCALLVVRKGITDAALTTGMALVLSHQEPLKILRRLGGHPAGSLATEMLMDIAQMLVQQYEQWKPARNRRSVGEFVSQLKDLQKRWGTMPDTAVI